MNTIQIPRKMTLLTWVVGRNYRRHVTLEPGAPIFVERESDNACDRNAFRVANRCGETAGYVPAYDAACLAPLVDRGWILLSGEVTGPCGGSRQPLRLIAEPLAAAPLFESLPGAGRDAFHREALLWAWRHAAEIEPRTIERIRDDLRDAAHAGEMTPENHFLYRFLIGLIDERREAADLACRQADEALRARLAAALGEPRFGPFLDRDGVGVLTLLDNGTGWRGTALELGARAYRLGALRIAPCADERSIVVENAGGKAILAPVQSVFCDGLAAWRTATAVVVPPAGAARVAAERVPMGTASAVEEIEDGRRATRLVGFGPPADMAKEKTARREPGDRVIGAGAFIHGCLTCLVLFATPELSRRVLPGLAERGLKRVTKRFAGCLPRKQAEEALGRVLGEIALRADGAYGGMGERIELTSKTFAGEALLVSNRLVQLTLDRVE